MATKQSNGNSDTVVESGEGEFDEIAFEASLEKLDPTLINSEEPEVDASEEPETEEEELPEAEEAEESEPEEEEAEDETEEEGEEDSEDVLSQIDFDALTDDQKQAIAKEIGSGAGKELGKLRGEIRELKEGKESLQKQLDEGLSKMLPTNNPHSDIHSLEDLDTKAESIESSYRYMDKLLRGTDEYFDISLNNGKTEEWDRAKVGQWKDYYEEQVKAIPAQRKAIKELESIQGLTNEEVEKAKAEVKFFEDEESSQFKEWKKLTNDSEFSLMARAFPKLGAKLARALAHSVEFKSKKPIGKIKLPLKKAKPINGQIGGAKSATPRRGKKKVSDSVNKRIQSGDYDDEDIMASLNIS
jgi:hypothetical protein